MCNIFKEKIGVSIMGIKASSDSKEIMNEVIDNTMSNDEILEKSIITTDAIANDGKLNTEQANEFLDYVFDVTTMKNVVRVSKFRSDKKEINKISVHKRVALPHSEATNPANRRGIKTSKVVLEPEPIIVPFEISDEFELENLEGETIRQRVIRMMSTQFANDLEELYTNGNKAGYAAIEADLKDIDNPSLTNYVRDSFLQLQDGWFKLMDAGHIHDAANSANLQKAFAEALKKLPEKYKRRLENLCWFVPTNVIINYLYALSTRDTSLGDSAISKMLTHMPMGVEMKNIPALPMNQKEAEIVTLTGTTPTPLLYENIVAGSLTLHETTLDFTTPQPAILATEILVDLVNGTIAKSGGSSLPDGDYLVTYKKPTVIGLTYPKNLIVGVAYDDIRVENDRDIYKQVNQFALSAKVACAIEEVDACVKIINVKDEAVAYNA